MLTPADIAKGGSESDHQKALFAWAALNLAQYPELELLFAIPNGGKRDKITASRMKAEGVKAGVPDICLPVARVLRPEIHMYHSLYLEMKVTKGVISPLQGRWHGLLLSQRNLVKVAYTWIEGVYVIQSYLNGDSV